MKKQSKEILAMAANLEIANHNPDSENDEEEKKDPFAENSKVGGLFSSKAQAAGPGSGLTSLSSNHTSEPAQNEREERRKRLNAQRDLIVKKKK